MLAGLHLPVAGRAADLGLMVEDLSPGLSAFYATVLLIVILLTQKPLLAYVPRRGASAAARSRRAGTTWSTGSSTVRAT